MKRSLRGSPSRSLRCRCWPNCLKKRGIRHRGDVSTGGPRRCSRCWRGGLTGTMGSSKRSPRRSADVLGAVVNQWGRSPNVDPGTQKRSGVLATPRTQSQERSPAFLAQCFESCSRPGRAQSEHRLRTHQCGAACPAGSGTRPMRTLA